MEQTEPLLRHDWRIYAVLRLSPRKWQIVRRANTIAGITADGQDIPQFEFVGEPFGQKEYRQMLSMYFPTLEG